MASRNGSRLIMFLRGRNRSWPLREVLLVDRRTGNQHRTVLSIIEIGGHWYVGHPDGESRQWVRDMLATRSAVVIGRDGGRVQVVCIPLTSGSERDAVDAASRRQTFPANLVDRAAHGHVNPAAYFRLQPVDSKTID